MKKLYLIFAVSLLSACATTDIQSPGSQEPLDRSIPDSAPSDSDRSFSNKTPREPKPRVENKSRYGNPPYYEQDGKVYHVLDSADGYIDVGVASWYGKKFHGRRTSSGEIYDMYQFTAAHKTLPLPSYARVTNIDTGKTVVVKVNDRGPFVKNRLIDLSYAAAKKLGYDDKGTARVEVQVLASPRSTGVGATYERGELVIPPIKEQNSTPGLFVQVGAFSDALRADTLAARLREFFQQPIKVTPFKNSQGMTLNRVRIGPLGDGSTAESILQQLRQYDLGSTPKLVTE
ncbi:septal ring lytic transglycosylase RlpA family protein [Kangiella sp. TOML190]|uniref:septal ring lytic transglycosylase RlpA family protein n=1 Tax=Kangiella sp. TOML190 TaxID=2931351 RepID=UPI0020420031|nr:septal ring lytic transglycosylase RlpA family protein [Kangiella sp. TOML190]